MAGLAEIFRQPMQHRASSGSEWADNLPQPHNDAAGRVYDPSEIMQAMEMLRNGQTAQTEAGRQFMMPQQPPMGWAPWWAWGRGS